MDTAIRVIEIVVGIGLLIMIHELGHFLAAKWAGVRVEKLAFGMGPRLLWFRRGETEYSIRAIPLGGFCGMAGEEPGAEKTNEPQREFRNQPPGKKAVILLAGVVMNFILAIVFFSVAFGVGLDFTRPLIGSVEPQSPAEKAGVLPGDEIVAINGDSEVDWEDIRSEIMMSDIEDNISLTVLRGEERLDLTVGLAKSEVTGLPEIGVRLATGRTAMEVEENSPAAAAGLKKDDVIETVDGEAFLNWGDVVYHMSARTGKPVAVSVTRNGESKSLILVPRPGKKGDIGVAPKNFPRVEKVFGDSPAARAGFKPDDRIIAVAGVPTPCIRDIQNLTAPSAGKSIDYTIRRGKGIITLLVTPVARRGARHGTIGIGFEPKSNFVVGRVMPGSAAEAAELKSGDVLTHVGKISLEGKTWDFLQVLLDVAAEKKREVVLHWERGENRFEKKVAVSEVDDAHVANVGISVSLGIRRLRKYPPWRAPAVGLKKSWHVVEQVYLFLRGVLTRRISPKHAAGPVGIVKMSYQVASRGLPWFIYWLGIIGANLAVVNLLPMPPLDGGLLVLTLFEKLRGRAVSEKWLIRFQLTGWAVVIVLVTLITINDLMR